MAKKSKKFDKGIRLKPTNENTALSGELSVSSVDNKLKATLESYADYTAVVHNVGDKVRHTDELNYVCIQTTTGAEDPSNASFWTVTERSIVTEDQTQELTNKTIDATDATGTNTVSLDASDATYNNATSGLAATDAQAAIDENDANLDAHIADAIDAHDASAISYVNTTSGLAATEMQAATDEIDQNLDDHLADTIDSHDASSISYNNATSGLTATEMQAATDELDGRMDSAEQATADHLADVVDAHDASAISYSNAISGLTATEAQAAIDEIDSDLDAHIADTVDAHDASAISNVPSGNLVATTQQAANDELQTDIDSRALNSDLTNHQNDTTTHGTTGDIVGTSDAQTLGNKTLAAGVLSGITRNSGVLKTDVYQDAVTTGADATMAIYGSSIVRMEHASLASLAMVASPEEGKELTLINATGTDITIKNDTGATAANRILTGTKVDIALKDEASIIVKYDNTESRWMVVGGVGGEGGGDTDVDVMFVDSFETSTIGDYAITGTPSPSITESASEVINGTKSLKLDHTTTSTAKRTIAVPNKFRNKNVKMGFDINSNATSGNITLDVVDETNTVTLVSAESIEPFNLTGSEKRRVWFDIPETCDSLSYEFTGLIEASAFTFIDDIQIEKEFQQSVTTTTDTLLKENEFSARIANNGTAAIDNENTTFLASATQNGTGIVDVVYTTGFFSVTPAVNATAIAAGMFVTITSSSATGFTAKVYSHTGTLSDVGFEVIVQRQGADYDANLVRQIETRDTFSEIVALQDRDISEINEFSARIANNGTATVLSENTSFIQSVSRIGVGTVSVVFTPNLFSVIPSVIATCEGNTQTSYSNLSVNGVTITTATDPTTYDADFNLEVSRQSTDVYNKTLNRIKTNPNQKIKIPSSEMRLEGSTSRGTGAETRTVKFDSLVKSIGGDLVLDNANGTIITCQKDGLLSVGAVCQFISQAGGMYITKNQVDNTTTPIAGEILDFGAGTSSAWTKSVSQTFAVKAGDKIRIYAENTPSSLPQNHLDLYFQEQEIQVGVSNILPKWTESDTCISLYGYGGYATSPVGSKIPILSTCAINNPNGKIAYTDGVEGNKFEILETGMYDVSCYGSTGSAVGVPIALTLNASDTTTGSHLAPESEILIMDTTRPQADFSGAVSIQREFQKGDIIRFHTDGTALNRAGLSISQVGKPNITAVDVTPFTDLITLDEPEEYRANGILAFASSNTKCAYFSTVTNQYSTLSKFGTITNDSADGFYFTATRKCLFNGTYTTFDVGADSDHGLAKNLTVAELDTDARTNMNNIGPERMFAFRGDNTGAGLSSGSTDASGSIILEVGDKVHLNHRTSIYVGGAGYLYPRLNFIVSDVVGTNKVVTEQDSNLSDWVDTGALTISATTTAPTKGTIVQDKVWAKRVGSDMEVRVEYRSLIAGAVAGSGDYLFEIPRNWGGYSNLEIDTDVLNVHTGSVVTVESSIIGKGWSVSSTNNAVDSTLMPYDSTQYRIANSANTVTGTTAWVSSTWFDLADANHVTYSHTYKVPIKGWTSQAKTLVAITRETPVTDSVEYETGRIINGRKEYAQFFFWKGSLGGSGTASVVLGNVSGVIDVTGINNTYSDTPNVYTESPVYEAGPYRRNVSFNKSTGDLTYTKFYAAAVYTTTYVSCTLTYTKTAL